MPEFPEFGLRDGRLHPNPRKVAKLGPPKMGNMGPFWHISSVGIFGGPARIRRSRATGTPGPHCRSGILQATGAKLSVQREAAYGDVHGKPRATLPRVALSMDLFRRR